ncbi:hypothetical protein AD47_2897 [Escherichia coli 6-319-05_S4_C3]|nr:hypothetical protein [Escherichia coli]KEM44615.1 hypothetical protein AD21_4871 [Escherichia coli 6-319-05_S4_C2]KEM63760.1 hypothetical protein AD47_2897 [Escherichia coli 6-319-05_S4_C3]
MTVFLFTSTSTLFQSLSGIDVSKKTLDLCLLREGVKGRVKTR